MQALPILWANTRFAHYVLSRHNPSPNLSHFPIYGNLIGLARYSNSYGLPFLFGIPYSERSLKYVPHGHGPGFIVTPQRYFRGGAKIVSLLRAKMCVFRVVQLLIAFGTHQIHLFRVLPGRIAAQLAVHNIDATR